MKHYLVTGGAGFIGSHLCDALLALGHEVTVVDDLSSGKRGNLAPEINFIQGDCTDLAILQPVMETISGVFHLAAVPSVQKSQDEWTNTTHTNLLGTVALLDAISKQSAHIPFVYASSAAVYGNPDESLLPLQESAPTKPLTPYGVDKLSSEMHARVANQIFGIRTLGLRFFNVYGPRQDPASPYSGVISIFMNLLRDGKAVSVFGDGKQTRDFIYVSDVAQCLMKGMERLESGYIPDAAVMNVCTGEAITVNALASQIASLCGIVLNTEYLEERTGDIRHSLGDTTKAREGFGIKILTSMEEGLRQTLDWMNRQG